MCINLCFLLATAKVLWGLDRLCQTSKIAGFAKTAWNCHVRIAGLSKTAWNCHVRIAGFAKTAWNCHVRIAGFAKIAWNYPKFGIILLSLRSLHCKAFIISNFIKNIILHNVHQTYQSNSIKMKKTKSFYNPPVAELLPIVPEGNMATSGVEAARQNYGDPVYEDWN